MATRAQNQKNQESFQHWQQDYEDEDQNEYYSEQSQQHNAGESKNDQQLIGRGKPGSMKFFNKEVPGKKASQAKSSSASNKQKPKPSVAKSSNQPEQEYLESEDNGTRHSSENNYMNDIAENSSSKNNRFDEYASVFQNLTEQSLLDTGGCVIVNIVINDKHDVAFVLAKESDELFYVQQFDMNTKVKI